MLQAGDSVEQAALCVAGRRAGGPGDGRREVEALVVPDDVAGLDGPLGGAFDGSSTARTAGNPHTFAHTIATKMCKFIFLWCIIG